MNDPWDKQGYQKPVVRRMSVEEMLTEAQTAVDGLFDRYHKAEANLGDQEEVLSAIRTELDGIEQALSKAERAVQRLTYVSKVSKGGTGMRPDPSSEAGKLTNEAADLMAKAAALHVPRLTELASRAYWGIVLEDTLDRLDEKIGSTKGEIARLERAQRA